jgi:hypothetical protein
VKATAVKPNFRFQRPDIEVAIHRSVQSQPSIFVPKLLLLIGLLFAIISLFLPFKAKAPYFIFKGKKNPGRQSSLVVVLLRTIRTRVDATLSLFLSRIASPALQ